MFHLFGRINGQEIVVNIKKCKMKRWILLIMVILAVQVSYGTICEDILTPGKECTMLTPTINCTTFNYTIYNETQNVSQGPLILLQDTIYKFEMNLSEGDYIVRLCDESTREIIVKGEDVMAGLAIVIFILSINFALFLFPFFKTDFVGEEQADSSSKYTKKVVNIIIRRACWAIAAYFMTLNSAIVATIAENAGLTLTNEMFRYMWIFGTAGWVLLVWLFFSTLVNMLKLWQKNFEMKRMGND